LACADYPSKLTAASMAREGASCKSWSMSSIAQTDDHTTEARFFPASPADAATLTPSQVEHYNEEGYLTGLEVFSPDGMVPIRRNFDELLERFRSAGRDSYAINGYHTSCRSIYDLVLQPRILDYVEDILGPNFVAWASHYFCKLPADGKKVPWHQDAIYWPIQPTHTVTVWLAIDDSHAGNGAMQVIPRTHREGPIAHERYESSDAVLGQQTKGVAELGTPRHLELKAGQISMHADLLVHGSDPNPGPDRRCGLTIRYASAEVAVLPDSKWSRKAIACRGDHGAWKPVERPEGDDLSRLVEVRAAN